jgi:hypothetical protein
MAAIPGKGRNECPRTSHPRPARAAPPTACRPTVVGGALQYGTGTDSPHSEGRERTMDASLEFEFIGTQACRDKKVGNCPQVATNVPGVVALRDSNRPDTIVTMTTADWATLATAVKAGEFDVTA